MFPPFIQVQNMLSTLTINILFIHYFVRSPNVIRQKKKKNDWGGESKIIIHR